MQCYIIYPTDLSEAELDSPECLSKLKVQVRKHSPRFSRFKIHKVELLDERCLFLCTGSDRQQVGFLQRANGAGRHLTGCE